MTKVEEPLGCWNKIESPLPFGAFESTLTGLEVDVVEAGANHYAPILSQLVLREDEVATSEMLLPETFMTHSLSYIKCFHN